MHWAQWPGRCWIPSWSVPSGQTQAASGLLWGDYGTSVNAIEASAGLNLINLVAAGVQVVLEGVGDGGPTQYGGCRGFCAFCEAASVKQRMQPTVVYKRSRGLPQPANEQCAQKEDGDDDIHNIPNCAT